MGMIGNTPTAGTISGASIQDGTVDTADLKDSAVTAAKLADANVTAAKLASGAAVSNIGFAPFNPTTSQTANYVYAAPNGSAGAPGFRALVAADIPALSYASVSQTMYVGTTGLAINRASASLSLTGVNIDGSAGSATNATNVSGGTASCTTGSFSGNLSFNSGYGSAAVAYGCRAWVNYNGTGTVAIRGSGNVSSITDNGVGNYTVNLATAMPDANFTCAVAQKEGVTTGWVTSYAVQTYINSSSQITQTYYGGSIDHQFMYLTIFR